MKILLTGDIHIGARNDSQVFSDMMVKFFDNIHDIIKKENIQQLWINGDFFEDRQYLYMYSKQVAFKIIDKLLENPVLEIKILLGNHDIYYKNNLSITSLKMFEGYHDRLEIIKTVKEFNIGNKKCIAYPWLCPDSAEMKFFNDVADNNKKYDLCLGHFEVNTFNVIDGVTCDFGVSVDRFKSYKHVFSGHFHSKQLKENVQYCGSPYELTWGECDEEKGVFIYDSVTDSVQFIKNTWSPLHIKLKVSDILKDQLKVKLAKNNWIKLFVDVVIDDNKRLDILTLIENQKPLEYSVIDEVEGTDIDNENIEMGEFEGNEISFMNEYIDQDQVELNTSIDKNELKLFGKELYEECLKDKEQ